MRTGANAGGSADFYPKFDEQQREHCRLDLDKVEAGQMTPDAFVGKYLDALRALLS